MLKSATILPSLQRDTECGKMTLITKCSIVTCLSVKPCTIKMNVEINLITLRKQMIVHCLHGDDREQQLLQQINMVALSSK